MHQAKWCFGIVAFIP